MKLPTQTILPGNNDITSFGSVDVMNKASLIRSLKTSSNYKKSKPLAFTYGHVF